MDLTLMSTELDEVRAKRAALREQHKWSDMPESARAEDIRLVDRADRLIVLIEEEKQRMRDARMDQTAKYLDDPNYQIPRGAGINADEQGKRTLQERGWKISDGMVMRQTSVNEKMVAFCPEEVLFGPLPDGDTDEDREARGYFGRVRAIMQPEYRNAYVKWIRSKTRSDSMAFTRLSAGEQNALSEGQDASGGFLVPPDIQAEILVRLPQYSVMRRLARVVPTSRDKIQFPAVAPNATYANSNIYSSGFVGGWAGETPAFSDTDPTFGSFEIAIKKLRVATKLSNDWLADAAANMLAFMSENGAANMGLVEDQGFISGNGTALQPLGLLNTPGAGTLVSGGVAPAMAVDVEGSTANLIINTTSAVGSAPKITNLTYQLPSQYAERASILIRRAIEGKIRALTDAQGRPMWLATSESGFNPPGRSLMGYPVMNSEFMPDDGTDGNKVIVVGDFSAYIIGQRAQMSTVVLRERFADTDQTGIILFERVGGGCWNYDAFRIGIV